MRKLGRKVKHDSFYVKLNSSAILKGWSNDLNNLQLYSYFRGPDEQDVSPGLKADFAVLWGSFLLMAATKSTTSGMTIRMLWLRFLNLTWAKNTVYFA